MFLVSGLPHVFSNGYQIRFSEIPNPDCAIGYIVPEWVSTNPTYSDIQAIYGSGKAPPNTVIILPLKPKKVEAVKKKLSEIHPEVLLFLNKSSDCQYEKPAVKLALQTQFLQFLSLLRLTSSH